jgi:broad specificity phosphatase PhoE
MQDVEARVMAALRRSGEAHDGASIAAVSHEIPIRLVIAAVTGLEGSTLWDIELPTGGVYRLDLAGGALTLVGRVEVPST